MTWLLSIVLGALPDLWIVAALAATALYTFAWWQPGRLSAEVVRLGQHVEVRVTGIDTLRGRISLSMRRDG